MQRRTLACRPCERLLGSDPARRAAVAEQTNSLSRSPDRGRPLHPRFGIYTTLDDGITEFAAIDLRSQADLTLPWRCGRDTPATDRQVDFDLHITGPPETRMIRQHVLFACAI